MPIRQRISEKQRATAWDRLMQASKNGGRSPILASQLENEWLCFRPDAVAQLRAWEGHGWGKVIVGRRGHDTRLMISIAARKALIAKVPVPPEAGEEPVSNAQKEQLEGNEGLSRVRHAFQLRTDLRVELELPSDLSDREAARLARFVESLPL